MENTTQEKNEYAAFTTTFLELQELYTCIFYPFPKEFKPRYITKYQMRWDPEHPEIILFAMRVKIVDDTKKIILAHFIYVMLFGVKELPEMMEKSEDKKIPQMVNEVIAYLGIGLMRGILFTKLKTSSYNPLFPSVLCDGSEVEEIIGPDNKINGMPEFLEKYDE